MSYEIKGMLPKSPEVVQVEESDYYIKTILGIEEEFKALGLNHRFVGGTFTDLLSPQTTSLIDVEKRTLSLVNSPSPVPRRKDGTIKDLDIVCFGGEKELIGKVEDAYRSKMKKAIAEGKPYPYVSLEYANRAEWTPRKRHRQFVTTFDVDGEGVLSLNFRSIHQPISWESVEPWTVNIGEKGSITILNPYAHALCYALRVPSGVKKKDKEIVALENDKLKAYNKMFLIMSLAKQVREADLRNGVRYNDKFNSDTGLTGLYRPWIDYINKLLKNPDPVTRGIAKVTKTYWNTIGTRVAHGGFPFGVISRFSNRTGG
ncbi:MAG: hypothetical protein Q7K55_01790 [Candidatus Levybacteria bacterium]|nr:hypothetical protein [Candidatus Levybacteria bacterium]